MNDVIKIITPILQSYGVTKAGIFGSTVKGNQTNHSDVDILIQPPDHMGLKFVRLKHELEQALNREVDLVSYNAIHPAIKDEILKSQVVILY